MPMSTILGVGRLRHETFIYLPRQPSDKATGISAYGEFSHLVQTASRKRPLLEDTKRDAVREVKLTQSMPRQMPWV